MQRKYQSGCGPGLHRDELGRRRLAGLVEVVHGHASPSLAEHGRNRVDHGLVLVELLPGELGERLTGEIILGRAQTAAHDHRIRPLQRPAERVDDATEVVTNLGLEMRVEPDQRQLLANPAGVGVDDLSQEQFGTDCDDFDVHLSNLPNRAWSTRCRRRIDLECLRQQHHVPVGRFS